MGSRSDRRRFCTGLVIAACFLPLTNSLADTWIQTDWSGRDGYLFYEDSTAYYVKSSSVQDTTDDQLSLQGTGWIESYSVPGAQKAYSLSISKDSAIYVGTGDNIGSIYRSEDDGLSWDSVYSGSGWLVTKPILVRSNGYLYVGMYYVDGNKYMLKDPGGPSYAYSLLSGADSIYALIESDGYLIVGAGDGSADIYKELDVGGGAWSPHSSLSDNKVRCIMEVRDALYASTGDNNGIVAKSGDNGDTWAECADLPGAKSVYSLCQGGDSAIYAGTDTSGIVYKTVDGGTTWIESGTLHLATRVRSLIYVSEPSMLVAGCECEDDTARAFLSVDNGENWIPFGAMAGATIPYCLLYSYGSSLLAGTDHNGTIFKASGEIDSSGWLISSIYNTGGDNNSVKYDTIRWDAEYNGQSVVVRVRSLDDTVTWSDTISWADCPPCSNGQYLPSVSSVRDSIQFIQYRLEFSTQNPFLTPVFNEIGVGYSLDTIAPCIDSAEAYGDEELVAPDSVVIRDRILIAFDEPVDTFAISSSNIDSLLRLSNGHTWVDSFGSVTGLWDTTCQVLMIYLGGDGWSKWVNVGDTIHPVVYQTDSIADIWGNKCISWCIIDGSFGPAIDSIVAHEGLDSLEYVDNDDYVSFYFSKRTNKPRIDASNIDSILQIPGRTWLDGLGELRGDSCVWDSFGFALTCSLKIDSLRPTIRVGDTVWSDSVTIWDKFERGVLVSPCVIQGTLGEYGPVMEQATAYEGWPPDTGVGDGDHVWISFNKLIDTLDWDSLDIDTVLIAENTGVIHTWHPESLDCHVQQMEQQDAQGFPYTLLYVSFEKWDTSSVEEKDERRKAKDERLRCYPSPSLGGTMIEFHVASSQPEADEPLAQELGVTSNDNQGTGYRVQDAGQATRSVSRGASLDSRPPPAAGQVSLLDSLSLAIGDTIYPNPNVITDFQGRGGRRFVILEGELKDNESNGQLSMSNRQLATKRTASRTLHITHDTKSVTSDSPLTTHYSPLTVSIKIYSLAGRLVRTLVDKEVTPGAHKVLWDGKDGQGKNARSGVYFCKLRVNGKTSIRKLTLLSSF